MIRKSTLTISIISLLSAIYLMLKSDGMPYFNYIFLLPLCFCVLQFLKGIKEVGGTTNIVVDLMSYVGVIRYILSPIVLQLSDCATKITNYSVFENDTVAIVLQLYEMVAIWSMCLCSLSIEKNHTLVKFGRFTLNQPQKMKEVNQNALFDMILVYGAAFAFCIIRYPALLNNYYMIWDITKTSLVQTTSTVPSIFYALSQLAFNGLRVTTVIYLIKKISIKQITDGRKIFYLIMVAILSTLIVSDNRAFSFFYMIALLVSILIVFPNKKKLVFGAFGIFGAVAFMMIIAVASLSYMASDSMIGVMSQTFQSYFQGTSNIAVSLCLEPYNIDRLIPDVGKSITGIAYFFQSHEDIKVMYNRVFYLNSARSGQIIPFIGQGYVYFGYILSPVLSCFVLRNAFKANRGIESRTEIGQIYIQVFKTTIAVVSLAMYSFTIYVSVYATMVVPMIISYGFNRLRSNLTKKDRGVL